MNNKIPRYDIEIDYDRENSISLNEEGGEWVKYEDCVKENNSIENFIRDYNNLEDRIISYFQKRMDALVKKGNFSFWSGMGGYSLNYKKICIDEIDDIHSLIADYENDYNIVQDEKEKEWFKEQIQIYKEIEPFFAEWKEIEEEVKLLDEKFKRDNCSFLSLLEDINVSNYSK